MTLIETMTVLDEAPIRREDDEAGFGSLNTTRGGLPLRRLTVDGRITGLLYRLVVAQTFVNAHTEPLEATYIFPLPARAGVTRFRLRVGERIVEGALKERGAARDEYDQALRQGHRAAIAEQERPEVFTIRAGNIPPGEAVGVELELAGPLAFADGEATFHFPLVVAPRYIPGIALDGAGVGSGVAPDTDAVPDASRISPPVLLPGQPNPVYLSFRLELDPAGLPLRDLRASLHDLRLSQTREDLHIIELTPGTERLDRDVILRFRVGETNETGDPAASLASGLSVYRDTVANETIALLTLAPPAILPVTLRPRDVVVLLDRSGSMDGWKMVAARRAAARLIDTLTDRDRFGLILFDHQIEEPVPRAGQLIPASDRARFRAVECLARVEARGGTEIAAALRRALQYFPTPTAPDRERIVLFVTDGQVGNEDSLLRQVQRHAKGCRIVSVGIDQAVNASLLERLAGYGGGWFERVESEDRLDAVLRAMHRRLGAPLLTDLRLTPALAEATPEVADLFPGVPLRLAGRWRGDPPAQVTVSGRTADGHAFQQTLVPVITSDRAVRTCWARTRVLDLEQHFAAGQQHPARLAEDITAFSLQYGVLCRFTAFVAVDHGETLHPGGKLHSVVQAVESPAGWDMPMMAGAAPPAMRGWAISNHLERASTQHRAEETESEHWDRSGGSERQFRESAEYPAPASRTPPPALHFFERFQKRATARPSKPMSPPPTWFIRLESGLNAPTPDPAEGLAALRDALLELEALGEPAAKLVEQGRLLERMLVDGRMELTVVKKRLIAWLRRVRAVLGHPPKPSRRWFWWK